MIGHFAGLQFARPLITDCQAIKRSGDYASFSLRDSSGR
jgi:hypothetical protein